MSQSQSTIERPAYLVDHEDVFESPVSPDILEVHVCRNCQAAMSSCICTDPASDRIPIWRDGTGENSRLIHYLKAKKESHKGSAPQSPEEMKRRQTLWAPQTLEDWAVDAANRGYYVFACWPKSKAPATAHGFKDSTNDIREIRKIWRANPQLNPAIDLGRSNLVAFDFDKVAPFTSLPLTFTVQTGRDAATNGGIPGIQMYYKGSAKTRPFGADGETLKKDSEGKTHPVGEVRSRGAYVMAPGAVHPSGNIYKIIRDIPLAISPEQNTDEPKVCESAIGSDEQNSIGDYVEAAFDLAGINHEMRSEHQGGFKWLIACPWKSEHTSGKDLDTSSAVIMWPSGKLIYDCKHAHCQGIRQWKELREFMEKFVGHYLVFGAPDTTPVYVAGVQSNVVDVAPSVKAPPSSAPTELVAWPDLDKYVDESDIPLFDSSVIGEDNILRRFVDLISKNLGIADQFAFAVAKAVLGARMDGITKFEGESFRTNLYVALIGRTGTGKGSAWERMKSIIAPSGYVPTGLGPPCKIVLLDGLDSGAGLKDAFFDAPGKPILYFQGEVEDLGIKTSATRQPEILTTLIDLKENTTVTRTKAGKPLRALNNARLSAILCGQEGTIFTKALAGRTKLGLWDRMYPEFADVQGATKLPEIPADKAVEILSELNNLDYAITMTVSAEARAILNAFWNSDSSRKPKLARLRNMIALDAYMSAFARHATEVSTADALAAVKIAHRQLIIRKVCFTTEVPDKTGYYLGLIKKITERMQQQINAGVSLDLAAKSERDFLTLTHAYRDNEEHFFKRAWDVHRPVYLARYVVSKTNGQKYEKWLPQAHDDSDK